MFFHPKEEIGFIHLPAQKVKSHPVVIEQGVPALPKDQREPTGELELKGPEPERWLKKCSLELRERVQRWF